MRLRRIARILVLPVAALALSACVPSAPPTINCDSIGSNDYGVVLEWCHTRYHSYKIDNSSLAAQNLANSIASRATTCDSSLGNYHSTSAQLRSYYPAANRIAENLYCWRAGGPNVCPEPHSAATGAMNAWLNSSGHRANMDNFSGQWVNGGGACNRSRGLWFAVVQFHT